MRILFAIPHFYGGGTLSQTVAAHGSQGDAAPRIRALTHCIAALHQLYGRAQCVMQLREQRTQAANQRLNAELHVVVCTTGRQHLLDRLPLDRNLYQRFPTDLEPPLLGFQCPEILRDRWGNFDYYGYLEDDLVLHDPWLFAKLAWFNKHVGDDKLLLPNRFERGSGTLVHKAYVDGELREQVTARFQDLSDRPRLESEVLGVPVVFRRPTNPHAGCYFLNARQMQHWTQQPFFLDRDVSFIGPLESAATLGVMRAFKIYKPALENASFLEIEHSGDRFLRLIRPPSQSAQV